MQGLSHFWKTVRVEMVLEKQSFSPRRWFRELYQIPNNLRPFNNLQDMPNPLQGNIYIIIYDNHFKHFQPIASELTRRQKLFSVIYLNKDVYERRKGNFRNEYLINNFFTRKCYAAAIWFQLILMAEVILFQPKVEGKIYPVSRLLQVVNRFVKRQYMIHDFFNQLLKDFKRKLILFKAEDYFARTILSVARQSCVKTFAVQHGLINVHRQFCNLEVDQYLVWSDFFKERLRQSKAGCNAKAVGNAAYDQVFHKLIPRNHFDKYAPAILALPNSGNSHTKLEDIYCLLRIVAKSASAQSGLKFIIKPHPGDINDNAINYIRKNFPDLTNIIVMDRHVTIPFDSCDIVVINNSAAGMEAAIWGKPLIVVAEKREDVMVPQYIEAGAAVFANSEDSFNEKLNQIVEHYEEFKQNCQKFTQLYLANHGKAVERILEIVEC